MQRTLVTAGIILVAIGLALGMVFSQQTNSNAPTAAPSTESTASTNNKTPSPTVASTATSSTAIEIPEVVPSSPASPQVAQAIAGLHVKAITENQPTPVIGLGPAEGASPFWLEAQLTPWGGGLKYVKLLRYQQTIKDKTPYLIQSQSSYQTVTDLSGNAVPLYHFPCAAASIRVNGGPAIGLAQEQAARWRVVSTDTSAEQSQAVTFELLLVNAESKPVLKLRRTWRVMPGSYDMRLDQSFENLTDQPLDVQFTQYGPGDLTTDGGYVGDQRKVVLGYLQAPSRDNGDYRMSTVDFFHDRSAVVSDEAMGQLWPGAEPDRSRSLVWVAMSNRYFTSVLHPVLPLKGDPPTPAITSLERLFPTVRRLTSTVDPATANVRLLLDSAPMRLAPKSDGATATRSLNLRLYAGPKDPAILEDPIAHPDYTAMGLGEMIVYKLGMCAICTFEWISDLLMGFLRLIHSWFSDWGLAIILLVAVVRFCLHPLTKRSQVNMMKMSKQMAILQPEIKRLKDKYSGNQQKLNQEMMKLYREKGVNPAAMGLGCLPMFLQMPIWIALYAMLYFAIELRHESAFWGIFQSINENWLFLADLSSPDRLISFAKPLNLGLFELSSINILPLLMGVVFFLQQKYTAAPPAQTEQAQMQQKMMKWMVMLFPIFLYAAPSGLTLYILASTTTGIIESKRVRQHLKELEDQGRLFEKKKAKPGGFMDRLHKAAEARQKMMEQQQRQTSKNKKKR